MGKTRIPKGDVKAQYITIEGEVGGKVMAHEKVDPRDTRKYRGEILTPAVMISDNAFFDVSVKMMKERREVQEVETIHNPHPAEEIHEDAGYKLLSSEFV